MRGLISIFAIFLFFEFVLSECPNGCSGFGVCSARDMCTCDKNYEGNDCSQRTCPHAYAHADSPKGDLNMDSVTKSSWELTNSQRYPYGGTEFIYPAAVSDEGHFYMECANKGKCNRESGNCECFDGYEGSACQRTVCPNDCNGHGSCESISELAVNRGGTLFFKPKHTYLTGLTYTLWDQKVSYGCKCDPWFYGADCSLRRCKVGVDPMYEAAGNEIIETFILRARVTVTGESGSFAPGIVRLKYFDYWGESYHTKKISIVTSHTAAAAAIERALLALPNNVITEVSCRHTSDSVVNNIWTGAGAVTLAADTSGWLVGCKLLSNPGIHRLPEITTIAMDSNLAVTSSLTGSTQRGEDEDLCGTLDVAAVTALANAGTAATITGSASSAIADFASSGAYLSKVSNQYIAVSAKTSTTLTLVYEWPLPAISESTPFYYHPTKLTLSVQTVDVATHGSATMTLSANNANLVAGVIIFFENQIFQVVSHTTTSLVLDRAYGGSSATGGSLVTASTNVALAYWLTRPTTGTFTYVSECSGRGLCNTESGLCQCFKGYTTDNCETQNVLAF